MDFLTKEYVSQALRSVFGKDVMLQNFECEGGVIAKGNNYCSDINRLIVKYRLKDDEVKVIKMIMKVPMTAGLYGFLRRQGIYEKERAMYDGVIQEMSELVGYDLAPLCYKTSHPEVILTEDLGEAGFRMPDRLAQLDFYKCCQALKVLGKFHAASIEINEKYPEKMTILKLEVYLKMQGMESLIERFATHVKSFTSAAEMVPEYNDEKRVKGIYRKITQKEFWTRLIETAQPRVNRLNVLNHGDFWSNNILFHRDTLQAKLIDFQSSRWCNPAHDIIYFTVTSVPFEIFDEKYQELLGVYLKSFNDAMKLMNRPERYDLQSLREDLNECKLYGVNVLVNVLPVMLSDPSNPIDLENAVEDGELKWELFDNATDDGIYIKKAQPWIKHFVNDGLI